MEYSHSIQLLRKSSFPDSTGGVGISDSIEKLLSQMSCMSPNPIFYKGKQMGIVPKAVTVGPSLFRKFICAPGCSACCHKITLDFLPEEWEKVGHKEGFALRDISVNGNTKQVYTNDQTKNNICDFLGADKPGGGLGCSQWPWAPLSCVSAPQLKFSYVESSKCSIIGKKPFGRAWQMVPSPQCIFEPADLQNMGLEGDIDLIDRFITWSNYFEIETVFPLLKKYIQKVLIKGTFIPESGYRLIIF